MAGCRIEGSSQPPVAEDHLPEKGTWRILLQRILSGKHGSNAGLRVSRR